MDELNYNVETEVEENPVAETGLEPVSEELMNNEAVEGSFGAEKVVGTVLGLGGVAVIGGLGYLVGKGREKRKAKKEAEAKKPKDKRTLGQRVHDGVDAFMGNNGKTTEAIEVECKEVENEPEEKEEVKE